MLLLSAILALSLALVHFFSGRLSPLQGTPRSRWLSLAGGVAVAYVFVHLLPDLSEAQRAVEEVSVPLLDYLRHHVYLVALLGLVAFYGLERAAKVARARQRGNSSHDATFWFHIGFFALYNAFIGYLVFHWELADVGGLFFLALTGLQGGDQQDMRPSQVWIVCDVAS